MSFNPSQGGNPNGNQGGGNSQLSAQAIDQALAPFLPKSSAQFRARLVNQILQLIRHGNFAETFIRTTPEGTDMVNFARLWEYILVQADRQSRGYVAKSSREQFEHTRKDFEDSLDFMVSKLKACVTRHKLDLNGTNFISRVAQRYNIAEKTRRAPQGQLAVGGDDGIAEAVAAPTAAPKKAPKAVESDTGTDAKAARPQRVSKKATSDAAAVADDVDAL